MAALVCYMGISPGGNFLLVRDKVPAVGCLIIYCERGQSGGIGVGLLYGFKSR